MNNYYIYSLFESLDPQPKDIKRIQDIITKSGGDMEKARKLASTMAGKIKDADKMERRFTAAVQELGEDHPVTEEFKKACFAMGIDTGSSLSHIDDKSDTDNPDDQNNFSTDLNTSNLKDINQLKDDDQDNDENDFSTDIIVEEEVSKYEQLQDSLEKLYNLGDIKNIDEVKSILNVLNRLNIYDSAEEGDNIVNLYNEIIHNIKISDVSKFISNSISIKEIHCIPATYESWASYPFKWNIAAPYRLYGLDSNTMYREKRYVPYLENNLPFSNNSIDPARRADSENISFSATLPNIKTSGNKIYPILIQAEIYSNLKKKTGKFEFLINPINFNLIKLHSDWVSLNYQGFLGKFKFLFSFADTPISTPGSNGAKLYPLADEYMWGRDSENINDNAKDIYNNYILPLHKGIVKLFRSTDNYKEFQEIFEYITMSRLIIGSVISDCENVLYNKLKSTYPDFPANVPNMGYPGWEIDVTGNDLNSFIVLKPKLYYTRNKVKKWVQNNRRSMILNPSWDELYDYSTNQTKAFNILSSGIKKALGAKLFKKCISSKNLHTIKIPWEIL